MLEIAEYKRLLGKRTRALRRAGGLTQAGLAERLGITQEYLGKIERGLASPSFPLLLGLARVLETEPADLLRPAAPPARISPRPVAAPPPAGQAPADLALRELRHRVRNCFQLLANLVNLELMRAGEEGTRQVLRSLAARIRCLNLMEGFLAGDPSGRTLDLGDKLRQVWEAVSGLYSTPQVRAEHQADPVLVPPATAQAVALVLTEFLTNMYKHAFPGRDSGTFRLLLEQRGRAVRLVLADNGVGLPPDPAATSPGSMGLTIMRSYVEHTLGGSMRLDGTDGTTLTVQFPLPQ